MSPQRETAPQGFDSQGWPLPEARSLMVDNFVRSWLQHWIVVVVLFVVAFGLVYFGAWLVTPTWEGQASIEVQVQPMPVIGMEAGVMTPAQPLTAGQMVRNLVQHTRSYNLLHDVIEQTRLDEYLRQRTQQEPDLRARIRAWIAYVGRLQFLRPGTGASPDFRIRALDELTSGWIAMTPAEGSTILPILVYGYDPDITVRVGNAILDQLQIRADADLRAHIVRQLEIVRNLAAEAEERVAANDRQLQEFRARIGYDPAAYAASVSEGIASLRQEQITFRSRLDASQAELVFLNAQLEEIPLIAERMRRGETLRSDILGSQQLQTQVTLRRAERARRATEQGPNAPAVRGLDAELEYLDQALQEALDAERRLAGTTDTLFEELDPRHVSMFNRWSQVTADVAALTARQEGLEEAIAALTDLHRQALAAQSEMQHLLRKARADEEHLRTLATNVRQLEAMLSQDHLFKALVRRNDTTVKNPNRPDTPRMTMALLLAVAVGAFTALVLPVSYDYLNQTLLTSRQVASFPGVRVVAAVPRCSQSKLFASV